MQPDQKWEEAFNTLDKRVFSADSIGGYDFTPYLKEYANIDSQILDYGCGKGQMVAHLRQSGYKNVWGTDPSQLLLENAKSANGNLKHMVDQKIPFSDGIFDLVYCSGVLHHIDWNHLPAVLLEIRRVLKPGGIFLYAEPRKTILRSLGHAVVMSPLNRLSKNARALSDCLSAEWPTYQPWLQKQDREFPLLYAEYDFENLAVDLKPVTIIGVLKIRK